MRTLERFKAYAVLAVFACAPLSGCGLNAAPVAPTDSVAQTLAPAAAMQAHIYTNEGVPSSPTHLLDVFTYRHGKFLKTLSGMAKSPGSLCSDESGDVYVTATISVQSSYVYEFGPGDTQPIRTLDNPGYGSACSVDPTTGNLAVANWDASYHGAAQGDIAVFAPGSGNPQLYGLDKVPEIFNCAYDGKGNLLADGIDHLAQIALLILPRGSKRLRELKFNKYLRFPGPMQWDGRYFAVGYGHAKGELFQVEVLGSEAKAVKTIRLGAGHDEEDDTDFWIHHGMLLAPMGPKDASQSSIGFWKYPEGGRVARIIRNIRKGDYTEALTVAPNEVR